MTNKILLLVILVIFVACSKLNKETNVNEKSFEEQICDDEELCYKFRLIGNGTDTPRITSYT